MGKKMLSGARDPRFGDQATFPKLPFAIAEVDDVIQQFFWEAGDRHRSFRANIRSSARTFVHGSTAGAAFPTDLAP